MAQTETISPRYRGLDTWSDEDVLDALWEGQARAVAAVRPALPAIMAAARAMAARLGATGRIIYAGAGSSGRQAALDGAELGATFGWPDERVRFVLAEGPVLAAGAAGGLEDDPRAGDAAMAALRPHPADAVIAVAASGRTPFTVAAALTARSAGALVIAIANNEGAPLLQSADAAILLQTGPEVISGSTRMNAGTAHKAALGLLSSLAMTRLGHVHDGLMVSLRAENSKLRDRAAGIVRAISGCSAAAASAALDRSGQDIKTATLVARGTDPNRAQALLRQADGNLRAALDQMG